MRAFLLVTIVFLLAPALMFGQTSNASLGGTVNDPSGAVLPGVEVSARNVGTGIVSTAITNETGSYQFPNLQTGTYAVSAVLPGFRTQQFNNVVLGVSQQVRLNFVLEVGNVATTVDVTEAADTALSTTSASIGQCRPIPWVGLGLQSCAIRPLLDGMMTESASLLVGLVSISDRASAGVYEDKGVASARSISLETVWSSLPAATIREHFR